MSKFLECKFLKRIILILIIHGSVTQLTWKKLKTHHFYTFLIWSLISRLYNQGKKLEYKNGMCIKMDVVCYIWCKCTCITSMYIVYIFILLWIDAKTNQSSFIFLVQDCIKSLYLENDLIFLTIYYCWCRYANL